MTLDSLLKTACSLLLLVACVAVLCRSLPRRSHFAERAVACSVMCLLPFVVFVAVSLNASDAVEPDVAAIDEYPITQFTIFSIALLLCFVTVLTLFSVSVWGALFICTASYTAQSMASMPFGMLTSLLLLLGAPEGVLAHMGLSTMLFALTGAAVLVAWDLLFVHRVRRFGNEWPEDGRTIVAVFAVLVFEIAFGLIMRSLLGLIPSTINATSLKLIELSAMVIQLAASGMVLFAQLEMLNSERLRHKSNAAAKLVQEQALQQELARASIDEINRRCHDLRHRIQDLQHLSRVDLEALERLDETICRYGSMVKTGNDGLDVLLTEKSLVCYDENIELTCIADGRCLSSMSPLDLRALVGNAMDNAIEAARSCPPERRSIYVLIRPVGEMASIHVENGFSGGVELVNGIPRPDPKKGNEHGWGTRSMTATVESYGGALSFSAQDGIFSVDALIPLA